MKVLHIGWGFSPWRGGGLIEYTEELINIQCKNGYEVYYFCSGRQYPFFKKPKLIKWRRDKFTIYEIINSPIIHGGDKGSLKPDLDLNEPLSEGFLLKLLNEIQPDIVHIQELAGLPSSLIEIIKKENVPVIMTLHDYFLLCPTLKLFDYTENICTIKNVGEACIKCCQAPPDRKDFVKQTIIYELKKFHLYKITKFLYSFIKKFKDKEKKDSSLKKINIEKPNKKLANEFQRRRDINIERLNKIDLLIAQSHKVEEIYKKMLNRKDGIFTLHSAIDHINLIKPKFIENINFPINFSVLNGCASVVKGSKIMLETIKILNKKGVNKFFKLHIFGGLSEEIKDEILSFNNVLYHGPYDVNELDKILNEIDIGIIPSVWEEVYGYVGIEFLAKGIPVIGNNKGGITDYVKDNLTGIVNKSSSAEELASIMETIIKNPNIIKTLNEKILKNRNRIIKNMEEHFYELDKIYKGLLRQYEKK